MKKSQTVSQQIAEIAQALGEDPAAIRADNPRWVDLLQEGVIVKVTLRRWRGKARLELDGDLGIPVNGEGELYRALLDIGSKLLLPRGIQKELDSIDSAARQNVERFGFKTHWGTFIPATAYAAWKEKDAEYQERYFAVRDQIIARYGEIIDKQLDEYAEAARVAYKRRNKLQPGQDLDWRINREDDFVEAYMARLRLLIPTKDQIAASFAYEVELAYIPLPSLLAADRQNATEIAVANEAERRRLNALDAMNREVIAKAQAEKESLVDGFLTDIVRQLRAMIYDAVTAVSDATAKNGFLHPRSVVQLQNLVAQVERLNFIGDRDAEAMVERLRSLAAQATTDRDPAEVQQALDDVALVTRASLLALGDGPRACRAQALPDSVPVEELSRARRALALDIEPQGNGNGRHAVLETEIGAMVDVSRRERRNL